jgi:hypothetical protein
MSDILEAVSNVLPVLDSIYDLRNVNILIESPVVVNGYRYPNDGGGGIYMPVYDDKLSTDDNGLIIVDKINTRWFFRAVKDNLPDNDPLVSIVQIYAGNSVVYPEIYGAFGNGRDDDTQYVENALQALSFLGGGILYVKNRYLLDSKNISIPENVGIIGRHILTDYPYFSTKNIDWADVDIMTHEGPGIILNTNYKLEISNSNSIGGFILTPKNYSKDRNYIPQKDTSPFTLIGNEPPQIINLMTQGFASLGLSIQ